LTLDECERFSKVLTKMNVQHKQKLLRGRTVEEGFAIILLEDVDKFGTGY